MQRVEIKNPNEDWLGTEYFIDGREVRNVKSVNFQVGVDMLPEFTFSTNGIPDIDVMARVIINPSPTNLQEACRIMRDDLLKHGMFYDSFVASVKSVLPEFEGEITSIELAERIVKRISGEE